MANKTIKIGTEGTGFIKKERSVMFSESCIKHLKSLVKRSRSHEKVRWDIFELMASTGGTLFLSGMLSLLTTTFDKNTQIKFYIALWVITIIGIIIGVIGLLLSFLKDKQQKSCLDEIEEILEEQEKLYET